MQVVQNLVAKEKYSVKCPYPMTPTCIVVHNTANDASARNEIAYMIGNNQEVSFHFAVDDKEVVQGIPLNRNAWHAGDDNGQGNRQGIAVEICYSKSGSERFDKAERRAAQFIAQLLKERNWGIERVTKHQDYAKKNCPHRTLEKGWQRFLTMVEEALQETAPQKKPTQQTAVGKDSVTYRVRTKEAGWLPAVTDLEDYAGYGKQPITDVAIRVKNGSVRYRVHVKGGGWLPYVTGYDVMDFANGYAGIGVPIDLLEVQYTPPKGQEGKGILYRVAPSNAPALYYDWQRNNDKDKGQDGYAGLLGHSVARLQMYVK